MTASDCARATARSWMERGCDELARMNGHQDTSHPASDRMKLQYFLASEPAWSQKIVCFLRFLKAKVTFFSAVQSYQEHFPNMEPIWNEKNQND